MKQAGTQALSELGFSVRKIAEIMKIDPSTVMRYQKSELNEDFQQFADTIKKIYLEQDFELVQLAVKHIKEKIKTARFFELVGLLKTVRDLQKLPVQTQQSKKDMEIEAYNKHIEEQNRNYLYQ